ncbi:unnamed protein product [Linum trigynum]|uniref:Uncharacterized protein n=1 Tax=Linum trigynum TaxID=586398 RepID=A0AAV2E6J1_9ROSI
MENATEDQLIMPHRIIDDISDSLQNSSSLQPVEVEEATSSDGSSSSSVQNSPPSLDVPSPDAPPPPVLEPRRNLLHHHPLKHLTDIPRRV